MPKRKITNYFKVIPKPVHVHVHVHQNEIKANESKDMTFNQQSKKTRLSEGTSSIQDDTTHTTDPLTNKSELTKKVVVDATKSGKHPKLKDLLIDASWKKELTNEFNKKYFDSLQNFIETEWNSDFQIFPPAHFIFNALNLCSFQKVKVVIIGQDPYHGLQQAMGLSFSVPKSISIPSSLNNIYTELNDNNLNFNIPNHGDLTSWANQGVLMLNAVLTVRAHLANSHANKGWESFTDAIIKLLNNKKQNLVFMLWGNYAKKKGSSINKNKHCVLETVHPSGLSANRGFFGCKHFSLCNSYLKEHGKSIINWNSLNEHK